MNNVLVDTCFWFAYFDERDSFYQKAQELKKILNNINNILIIPHPVLYETLNTRFVSRKLWMDEFKRLLESPSVVIISDEQYKARALDSILRDPTISKRTISLVDMIIRLMIEDVNLNVSALITFNEKDFIDLCMHKRISLLADPSCDIL